MGGAAHQEDGFNVTDAMAQGGAQPVPDPRQQEPEQRDPHQSIDDAEDAAGICAQGYIAIAWAEGPSRRSRGYLAPPCLPPGESPATPCPPPHAQSPPPPMVVMMVPEKKKALPRSQAE